MIPACSQTGTPRHFHVSTTSGSACLMRRRMRASVSPRQSLSSLILASISREGDAPLFSFVAPLLFLFMAAPSLAPLAPLPMSAHFDLHGADLGDRGFDQVAGLDRPDAFRRAGQQRVARHQGVKRGGK